MTVKPAVGMLIDTSTIKVKWYQVKDCTSEVDVIRAIGFQFVMSIAA